MIEICFRYERKIKKIKDSKDALLKSVCECFAEKNSLDFEELFFTYKGTKLNLDLNLSIKQQFNLDDNIKKNKFILEVYKQNTIWIKFCFDKKIDFIKCKKRDKIFDIIEKYINEQGLKGEDLHFKDQTGEFINFNRNYMDEDNNKTIGELIKKNGELDGIMTFFCILFL